MIDSAGIKMAQGVPIACERISGVNDNMIQSHYHDYYELYYLESGERTHVIESNIYHIQPGQFILFPPFVMHRSYGKQDIPFKRIVLYFTPDQIIYPELKALIREKPVIFNCDKKQLIHIHRLLTEILKEDAKGSPFLLEEPLSLKREYMHSILNTLIITIFKSNEIPDSPENMTQIGKILDYIHQNYNKELSLEFLSGLFYISPYHLCHEFKKYTNRTLVEYINITRIMNAQRKIMETNLPLTKICHETGFSNSTHFCRVFKQIVNITPSEYRKHYRQSVSDTSIRQLLETK